jgi:DHA2 family multidrug resistance protein-like MFS transporter
LLDLQLFRTGVFSTALSTMWFTGVVMAGISLASALYLQLVQGFPPLTAGLWLIPQNIAMVIGLLGASRLAQRFRASRLMATGLLISASGFVALAFVPADGGLPVLIAGLLLVSLGMGLPMSLTGSMILGSAPPEKAGSAAAVMETSGEFGVAVGVATLGSLTTFIYREQVSDAIPANASAEVAGAVRESLAMAVGVAQQMGGQLGTELLQQARAAFAAGLNTISAIGALIYVVLAVLCLLVLRKADAPARPDEEAAGVSTTTGPAPAAPAGINQ